MTQPTPALRQRGSHLLVLQGRAEQLIPQLVTRFNLQEVLTLEEIAPQERQQLQQVRAQLGSVALWEQTGNGVYEVLSAVARGERVSGLVGGPAQGE